MRDASTRKCIGGSARYFLGAAVRSLVSGFRRIVIVEDDKSVLGVVATVANGRDALAQIASAGADLVITDFQMPGMGADELARRMRAQHLETAIIMVSGARSAGESAGINRFVYKTNFNGLPAAIRSLG